MKLKRPPLGPFLASVDALWNAAVVITIGCFLEIFSHVSKALWHTKCAITDEALQCHSHLQAVLDDFSPFPCNTSQLERLYYVIQRPLQALRVHLHAPKEELPRLFSPALALAFVLLWTLGFLSKSPARILCYLYLGALALSDTVLPGVILWSLTPGRRTTHTFHILPELFTGPPCAALLMVPTDFVVFYSVTTVLGAWLNCAALSRGNPTALWWPLQQPVIDSVVAGALSCAFSVTRRRLWGLLVKAVSRASSRCQHPVELLPDNSNPSCHVVEAHGSASGTGVSCFDSRLREADRFNGGGCSATRCGETHDVSPVDEGPGCLDSSFCRSASQNVDEGLAFACDSARCQCGDCDCKGSSNAAAAAAGGCAPAADQVSHLPGCCDCGCGRSRRAGRPSQRSHGSFESRFSLDGPDTTAAATASRGPSAAALPASTVSEARAAQPDTVFPSEEQGTDGPRAEACRARRHAYTAALPEAPEALESAACCMLPQPPPVSEGRPGGLPPQPKDAAQDGVDSGQLGQLSPMERATELVSRAAHCEYYPSCITLRRVVVRLPELSPESLPPDWATAVRSQLLARHPDWHVLNLSVRHGSLILAMELEWRQRPDATRQMEVGSDARLPLKPLAQVAEDGTCARACGPQPGSQPTPSYASTQGASPPPHKASAVPLGEHAQQPPGVTVMSGSPSAAGAAAAACRSCASVGGGCCCSSCAGHHSGAGARGCGPSAPGPDTLVAVVAASLPGRGQEGGTAVMEDATGEVRVYKYCATTSSWQQRLHRSCHASCSPSSSSSSGATAAAVPLPALSGQSASVPSAALMSQSLRTPARWGLPGDPPPEGWSPSAAPPSAAVAPADGSTTGYTTTCCGAHTRGLHCQVAGGSLRPSALLGSLAATVTLRPQAPQPTAPLPDLPVAAAAPGGPACAIPTVTACSTARSAAARGALIDANCAAQSRPGPASEAAFEPRGVTGVAGTACRARTLSAQPLPLYIECQGRAGGLGGPEPTAVDLEVTVDLDLAALEAVLDALLDDPPPPAATPLTLLASSGGPGGPAAGSCVGTPGVMSPGVMSCRNQCAQLDCNRGADPAMMPSTWRAAADRTCHTQGDGSGAAAPSAVAAAGWAAPVTPSAVRVLPQGPSGEGQTTASRSRSGVHPSELSVWLRVTAPDSLMPVMYRRHSVRLEPRLPAAEPRNNVTAGSAGTACHGGGGGGGGGGPGHYGGAPMPLRRMALRGCLSWGALEPWLCAAAAAAAAAGGLDADDDARGSSSPTSSGRGGGSTLCPHGCVLHCEVWHDPSGLMCGSAPLWIGPLSGTGGADV